LLLVSRNYSSAPCTEIDQKSVPISVSSARLKRKRLGATPIEKARVRQARDDGRPTEDDLAKAKLGPQGVPHKPDKPPIAYADKLQLPKAIDPGHTV
jgi:hypothetical protein